MKCFLFVLILFMVSFSLINDASAVCCFPYEITHYIDPETGYLIIEGQLWNDSYRGEPFGTVNYQFQFFDSERNVLFERDISLTNGLPINGGFVIPPGVALPFHIVIDDVDEEIIQKIHSVSSGGNNVLEYFSWKPADLKIKFDHLEKVAIIHDSKNQDIFYKWKISGTITNTHSEKAHDVYVTASLLEGEYGFLGTAGYSKDDIHPLVLDGFETKDFVIYSILPKDKTPDNVSLYAESSISSMIHQHYKPIILKNIIDYEGRVASDPKKPILISANVTNISRENFDLDWIIQIKKSPKSIAEGDMTKYPESKVEFIKKIPVHIDGQKSVLLEYPWIPQSGGIYFYEMYLWNGYNPVSYPFTGNFFSQGEMFVSHNLYSIKNQINSGTPLDELVCREGLKLVHMARNANLVCVKYESIPKLIERGWIITNHEDTSFEIITPESTFATFYAQPQITSVILKQDSTVRIHLFSYIKESDEWDMVFDRIFDIVPKNFKIGIVENTPENINEFVTLGKENLPSGINVELLREGGYFVIYFTSNKSLEPGKYDLSIVSVDKAGTVIQKPLFVIAVKADTTPTQSNTVKISYNKHPWEINLENISEQEYWIRSDRVLPSPPSPILNVTQDNIHPDVQELIDLMWSQDTKYVPSEYDKKILLAENETNLKMDPQKIRDWLETTYVQQFKRNLDDSYSNYIRYDGKIYSFGFVIAD